jgi:hypothetical protein
VDSTSSKTPPVAIPIIMNQTKVLRSPEGDAASLAVGFVVASDEFSVGVCEGEGAVSVSVGVTGVEVGVALAGGVTRSRSFCSG